MVRSQWGSSAGFVLSAVGSAIGLGTIWRFPYLAGKYGGGLFLFTYTAICLTLGLSLMVMEMALGRTAQTSAVGAYRATANNKDWQAVGVLNVATCWLILLFYNIVGGWVLFYIINSLNGTIPFQSDVDPKLFETIFGGFIVDPIQPLIYGALFTLTTLFIVMGGVRNGIERLSKILLPVRLILMLALIVRAVTLPGGIEGVKGFLLPNFSKFSMPMVLEAMGLAFFTLSLAMGIVITYGSYASHKTSLVNSAKWTVFLTVFACFLAGLIILPAVSAFGIDPSAGPSLVFIAMPAIFSHIPLGAVFAVLFFVTLYFAAQLSAVSLFEVLTSFLIDEFHIKRRSAAILATASIVPFCIPISLSLGIWSGKEYQFFGKTFFDLADYLSSCVMLPIAGISMAIFSGWIIWDKLETNLFGDGSRPSWLPILKNGIRFVAPLLILVILIQSNWPIF